MATYGDVGYAVDAKWRKALDAAAEKQAAAWREYHSHCGHAQTDDGSIVCDITEAYCTYVEETAAGQQREAWRRSEPLARTDGQRVARDHYFALEIAKARG
jgi:hypothetical protein